MVKIYEMKEKGEKRECEGRCVEKICVAGMMILRVIMIRRAREKKRKKY